MASRFKDKARPGLLVLRVLRVLSVILLIGPPLTVGGIWAWMAMSGLSPARRDIFELGEQIIVVAMGLGVLGLLAEFVILPILLTDRATGRADGGP